MRSIERVRLAADRLGLGVHILELEQSTRTAKEAADACGCPVSAIVKSMVFERADDGSLVLVLVSGAHNADLKKLKALFGCKLRPARPEKVREQTGFAIGGVAPVGHVNPIPVYMDEILLNHERVWAAAGQPNALFEVAPETLRDKTGARIIQVAD
ncbi:MAG TPA: YbaK/EbsC family protein [Devosia sp.]|nr:YbaK/EbsC family protein [Devosia sp.]